MTESKSKSQLCEAYFLHRGGSRPVTTSSIFVQGSKFGSLVNRTYPAEVGDRLCLEQPYRTRNTKGHIYTVR